MRGDDGGTLTVLALMLLFGATCVGLGWWLLQAEGEAIEMPAPLLAEEPPTETLPTPMAEDPPDDSPLKTEPFLGESFPEGVATRLIPLIDEAGEPARRTTVRYRLFGQPSPAPHDFIPLLGRGAHAESPFTPERQEVADAPPRPLIEERQGRTDDTGHLRVPDLGELSSQVRIAAGDRHAIGPVDGSPLTLWRDLPLLVRTVDHEGRAAPDTWVLLRAPEKPSWVKSLATDARGEARFVLTAWEESVFQGRRLRAEARTMYHAPGPEETVNLQSASGTTVTVRLPPRIDLEFAVEGTDKEPLIPAAQLAVIVRQLPRVDETSPRPRLIRGSNTPSWTKVYRNIYREPARLDGVTPGQMLRVILSESGRRDSTLSVSVPSEGPEAVITVPRGEALASLVIKAKDYAGRPIRHEFLNYRLKMKEDDGAAEQPARPAPGLRDLWVLDRRQSLPGTRVATDKEGMGSIVLKNPEITGVEFRRTLHKRLGPAPDAQSLDLHRLDPGEERVLQLVFDQAHEVAAGRVVPRNGASLLGLRIKVTHLALDAEGQREVLLAPDGWRRFSVWGRTDLPGPFAIEAVGPGGHAPRRVLHRAESDIVLEVFPAVKVRGRLIAPKECLHELRVRLVPSGLSDEEAVPRENDPYRVSDQVVSVDPHKALTRGIMPDRDGRFELPGSPREPHDLVVSLRGMLAHRARIPIPNPEQVKEGMDLGSLQIPDVFEHVDVLVVAAGQPETPETEDRGSRLIPFQHRRDFLRYRRVPGQLERRSVWQRRSEPKTLEIRHEGYRPWKGEVRGPKMRIELEKL